MTFIFVELLCFTFIYGTVSVSPDKDLILKLQATGIKKPPFDYCEIDCNGTKHTMCQFPAGGGPNCRNNLKVYLTRAEKVYIEDNLNRIRYLIVTGEENLPLPSNMMKLVWDRELSTIAKRWADQCEEPLHDQCRLTMGEVDTGQTVYIGRYEKSSFAKGPEIRLSRIKESLEAWESEKKFFNPDWLKCYNCCCNQTDTHGNYSQIIWGTTEYVGCGYTEFQMKDHVMSRFVCNYKRRGCIQHHRVYREGIPCSGCPTRSVCSATYKGMCWNQKYGNYIDMDNRGCRLEISMSLVITFGFVVLYFQCNT